MRHMLLIVFMGFYFGFSGIHPVAANSVSDEAALVEADSDFTFRGQPIHPGLVKEFQNWLSDYRPPITVTLDIGAAYDSNEYSDAVLQGKDDSVSFSYGESAERFSYKHLGRLMGGIHVLYVVDKSAGTGIFQSVMFIHFNIAQSFDRDGIKPSQSLHMSVVRVYALVGPKPPEIEIKGNETWIKNGAEIIKLGFD